MSFVSFSHAVRRALALLVAAVPFVACVDGAGYAADSKRLPPVAVLPSPEAMASGAERVGKLLAERSTSSDPEIPLPQRNLTTPEPAFVPLTGARIYGRGEEGSVVVGLKIPIPADRGVPQQNTRYGAGAMDADTGGRTR